MKHLLLGLGCTIALSLGSGCVTKIDRARTAYADGGGSVEEAERLYREAMEDPGWKEMASEELYEMYLAEAERASDADKYVDAERNYRKALEVRPGDDAALSGLIETLRDLLRHDEALQLAQEGVASGGCPSCRRLSAVMLIERADRRMAESQWAAAEEDYVQAATIIPDASVQMGIVRARYGRKDVDAAAKALRQAVDHIGPQDVQARKQYLELRRAVVLMALEENKVDLADELLDLAPEGAPPEAQLGLAMEVAMEFRDQGKPDEALDRMTALVDAAAQGKLRVNEDQIGQLRDRVARIHASRASKRLAEGDTAGAEKDLSRAMELKPNHPPFELQKILLRAGKGDLAGARAELDAVDRNASGRDEVAAILDALEVDRLVEAGKISAAESALARARSQAAELPEVHIASAQVLARTQPDLARDEVAQYRKLGLVSYPGNRITRVGEALSELDWSKQQIRGLGTTYPYRAPDTTQRMQRLHDEITKFYPYAVKFQGDPTAVLVLRNSGTDSMTVTFEGGGIGSPAQIGPGSSKKVVVPKPGLVKMGYRGTSAALFTEPYTEVEVPL